MNLTLYAYILMLSLFSLKIYILIIHCQFLEKMVKILSDLSRTVCDPLPTANLGKPCERVTRKVWLFRWWVRFSVFCFFLVFLNFLLVCADFSFFEHKSLHKSLRYPADLPSVYAGVQLLVALLSWYCKSWWFPDSSVSSLIRSGWCGRASHHQKLAPIPMGG